MAYVYKHTRLDTEEVFYIGIGSDNKYKRANHKTDRNKFWKNITSKTDYSVTILCDNITWEEACSIEKALILQYGRRDLGTGSLVNLTDGGEGMQGYTFTEIHRQRMSNAKKGRKGGKGRGKGNTMTEEQRSKMGKHRIGKKLSEETRKKIGATTAKIVLNTQTGIYYFGIKEAAESINMSEATLRSWLRGIRPNKSSLIDTGYLNKG